MRTPARTLLCALFASSLLASSGSQARPRGENLVAGALAGVAVGVIAGSVFAPPPPRYHVYRVRPGWDGYLPPYIEHDWDDPSDEDWDD
ncbi:hypothetical protein [Chelatococcus asaccharovorans]|uniref:hypothetical protein n=1 Tax=Chelatococcus asaccharovorans TaxID=28210 RepID=UPI00224C653C|nr:hypothetical protein [Chelatococcus asaccharovorans]CAH1660575.1 conserved exported hypothetical protein [Chelatococcus asaccharovorans]CAH1683751.1 conserved exported hypothetical protein [Chelatococcus asaccharovorans]